MTELCCLYIICLRRVVQIEREMFEIVYKLKVILYPH